MQPPLADSPQSHSELSSSNNTWRFATWKNTSTTTATAFGMHQQYLTEHRPIIYSDLVLSGKLYSYLADIDTQARNKLDLLVTQMAEKEGINEHLKERDQLAWVRAMNSIRNRAEEIINNNLIFRK